MAKQAGKIGRKWELLLAALLTRPTIKEAAEEAGMSLRTAMRALADPVFREALQAAKRQVLRVAMTRLTINTAAAVDTLAEIYADQKAPASARVSASENTIRLALDDHLQDDLAGRIAKLERQSDDDA